MKGIRRVAFIGNYLPRRCGIATFTQDLHAAVTAADPELDSCVVAMTDPGSSYDYPPAVRFQIHDEKIDDYIQAAEFLNEGNFDVVCLQHEYGIFGGEAGGNIVELLSRLKMPIVTTLHTILTSPTPVQRRVMRQITDSSTKLVVMSRKGRELLRSVYDIPDSKIDLIPHGIPDFPFLETQDAKTKLGFRGKTIILTFGLLSQSKGIENVIDAMPGIIKSCPNAVYVILGATHPNLVRTQGESYRESLAARAKQLGIEDHVVFFNQFVERSTLLDFISMCDVYVTPYLNEAQMTSGTLAYSFGLGKAVVSTPYWHAKELLSDGRGILVPFGNAEAISQEISDLLTDDVLRLSMRKRAYASSRSMTWAQTAKRYLSIFETTREHPRPKISLATSHILVGSSGTKIPEVRVEHFVSLCDDTGMLQHAIHSVADRAHGYCIDDNARALLFSNALSNSEEAQLSETITARFAAFIQHAWNPDTRRFRNFMSYDRRWLEDRGSEDSHGRTLWALGDCASRDFNSSRRKWAEALFKTSLPVVEEFSSPRAWAFTLLGLAAYCGVVHDDLLANRMRGLLANRLMALFSATQTKNWLWFEDSLAYDNARLPQALILTGVSMHKTSYVDLGLQSLRWLMAIQTASSGCFRPLGTENFGKHHQYSSAFDQQPVEALATIAACIAASRADGGVEWPSGAMRAFGWFQGENDLGVTLINTETGSCSDGLHPDRPNENKGAESTLSYLHGLVEIRQFKRNAEIDRTAPTSKAARNIANQSIAPQTIPGSNIVSIPILEPADLISASGSSESRRQALQTRD